MLGARTWMIAWAALALGCGPGSGQGSSSTEAGSSTSTSGVSQTGGFTSAGSSATAATSDASGGSSGDPTGSTGGVDVCGDFPPNNGGDCDLEGAQCPYGDFCAHGTLTCLAGQWERTESFGCGADPVACVDDPVEGHGCDETEPCDPDGDCIDVLECEGSNWAARDTCNAIACPAANPRHGYPCDTEGWLCVVEQPCDGRTLRCGTGGHWRAFTPTCAQPVACDAGPSSGDACDSDGEVCTYPDPALDPVVCSQGTWG